MTPTPKLRFVEREAGFEQYDVKVTARHGAEVCYRPKKVRILQQLWEHTEWNAPGEWRDVPLEQGAK